MHMHSINAIKYIPSFSDNFMMVANSATAIMTSAATIAATSIFNKFFTVIYIM